MAWSNAATRCDALLMSARATAVWRNVGRGSRAARAPGSTATAAISFPTGTRPVSPFLPFLRPLPLPAPPPLRASWTARVDSRTHGETQSTSVPASREERYMRQRSAKLRSRSTLHPPAPSPPQAPSISSCQPHASRASCSWAEEPRNQGTVRGLERKLELQRKL